ncbi:hypothetical protein [Corynebacterium bouchesdurhonense]|uniref:hypothetical protein n=1 Tax=Corynebacterium bouchesdurhonense TaxID=1720192 RepID=UPI00082E001A|nr:hypothetical protein [Corynebacterium bouchesdurhonense]
MFLSDSQQRLIAGATAAAVAFSGILPAQPSAAQAVAQAAPQYYRAEYTYVHKYTATSNHLDVPIAGQWRYTVTEGGHLATVSQEAGKLVVVPHEGAKGDVVVVVTDSLGSTFKYTVSVDNTARTPSGPTATTHNLVWNFDGNGSGVIHVPAGGRWSIISGGENVSARLEGERLIIAPLPDAKAHTTVIDVVDPSGNTDRFSITVNVKTKKVNRLLSIDDGEQITLDTTGTWQLVKGQDLVTVREENGAIVVRAREGVGGEAIVVVKDPAGTEYRYSISVEDTTPEVEERRGLLVDGTMYSQDFEGMSTYRTVAGVEVISVTRAGSELTFQGKSGANGTAVVEILDARNRVTARYTYDIISTAKPPTARVVDKQMGDRDELRVTTRKSGNTFTIETGEGLLGGTDRVGNTFTLHPKQGADGTVVVLEKDENGQVVVRYNVTITPAPVEQVTYTITSKQTAAVTGSNLVLISGGEYAELVKDGDTWTIVPREGANGTVVVEGRDARGRTQIRYTVTITPAPAEKPAPKSMPVTVEHRFELTIEARLTIGDGHTIWINRPELVVVDCDGSGTCVITPAPGATGVVIIEERDGSGNVITRWTLTIAAPAPTPAPTPGQIEVIPGPGGGGITVRVPGSGGQLVVVGGDGEYTLRDNGDGTWTITRIDGKPVAGPLNLAWTGNNGDTVTNNITINAQLTAPTPSPGTGSSDGKCAASVVGAASPLLLLIPLGILTQVRIPGLEGLQVQLSDAIRETNAHIQEGLGIFNEDRANRAANVNDALAIVNPETIGLALGSLALIAAGLVVGDAVMRACGLEEATSSHAIANADTKADGGRGLKLDKLRRLTPSPQATPSSQPAAAR